MITEKELIELVSKVCEINKDWLREDGSTKITDILKSHVDNRAKTRKLFR
jgi:phage host-nuclease inhibitor protein Gam